MEVPASTVYKKLVISENCHIQIAGWFNPNHDKYQHPQSLLAR